MKTLDKVIKALEICSSHERCIDGCPYYRNECPTYEMEKDALHYLKEFASQNLQKMVNKSDSITEMEDNEPLSWDELRQMEGKPVWVDEYDQIDGKKGWHLARWYLINFIADDNAPEWKRIFIYDVDGEEKALYQKNMGTEWQAYRKER